MDLPGQFYSSTEAARRLKMTHDALRQLLRRNPHLRPLTHGPNGALRWTIEEIQVVQEHRTGEPVDKPITAANAKTGNIAGLYDCTGQYYSWDDIDLLAERLQGRLAQSCNGRTLYETVQANHPAVISDLMGMIGLFGANPTVLARLAGTSRSLMIKLVNSHSGLGSAYQDARQRRIDNAEAVIDGGLAMSERWAAEKVLTSAMARDRGWGQEFTITLDEELAKLGLRTNEVVANIAHLMEHGTWLDGSLPGEASDAEVE